MVDRDNITELLSLIHYSEYLVIFTGAGVSTASGIPDFRGPEGILTLKAKGIKPSPPTKPWHHHAPNETHHAIKQLSSLGVMKFLISQNVDNLHVKSGIKSSKLVELHGNANLMKCTECSTVYSLSELGWDRKIHGKGSRSDLPQNNQPSCPLCGGRIISTVVYFGDPIPNQEMRKAKKEAKKSDLFLVLGSSLSVYPAASFPRMAKKNGATLVIVNQGKTSMDNLADLIIDADVSVLLPKIVDML